jgi:hypothetical protein
MKVKELIELLQQFDPEQIVVVDYNVSAVYIPRSS